MTIIVQGSRDLSNQASGLASLVLVLTRAAGTYRFTDGLQVQRLQLLGHLLVPLTIPAIEVGRLEETPAEREVTLRMGESVWLEKTFENMESNC